MQCKMWPYDIAVTVAIFYCLFKMSKFKFFGHFYFDLVEIPTSVLWKVSPICWPLDDRWYGSRGGNMSPYGLAQVYPLLSPLSQGYAQSPCSTPLLSRLGQRVSPVKLKTLNTFYGHSRSFAHLKPYIKNYQHEMIYNPVSFVFR
jgi:hypothetical protein